MCYFGFRRATELQSYRAAEQQSSRGKNLFAISLVVVMSLFANFSTRADIPVPEKLIEIDLVQLDEQALIESCCIDIIVDTNKLDNCCYEILAYNYNCNANFKFEYYNPVTHQYETKHIQGVYNGTVRFVMCPEYGETILKFRVSVVDPGNENHYWCTYLNLEEEGWNVFTFEADVGQCCDCPDNEFSTWFTTTIGAHPDCPEGCKIQHNLIIPPNITCFKYYYYENMPLGQFISGNPKDLIAEPLSMYDTCIAPGQTSDAYIYLFRYLGDSNPCIMRDTSRCDTIPVPPPLPEPCDQSCPDSTWKYYGPIELSPSSCPGCELKVYFKARKRCDGIQQLEILRIEYFPPFCYNCSLWSIMRQSLLQVIRENPMEFKPLEDNQCDSTWQVGVGSCWATLYEYYLRIPLPDPTNYHINPFVDSVLVSQKCDSVDCCLMPYVVCKYPNHIRVSSGISLNDPLMCDYKSLKDIWGNYHLCYPNCEWMMFDTVILNNEIIELNRNIDSEHKSIKISDYHIHNNKLTLNSEKSNEVKTFIIYDILGNQIKEESLNNTCYNMEYDLHDLPAGVYFFILRDKDGIVQTGKFTKVQ